LINVSDVKQWFNVT